MRTVGIRVVGGQLHCGFSITCGYQKSHPRFILRVMKPTVVGFRPHPFRRAIYFDIVALCADRG